MLDSNKTERTGEASDWLTPAQNTASTSADDSASEGSYSGSSGSIYEGNPNHLKYDINDNLNVTGYVNANKNQKGVTPVLTADSSAKSRRNWTTFAYEK